MHPMADSVSSSVQPEYADAWLKQRTYSPVSPVLCPSRRPGRFTAQGARPSVTLPCDAAWSMYVMSRATSANKLEGMRTISLTLQST